VSILQDLIRDADLFEFCACNPSIEDKDLNLIVNVRMPVDKITEEAWHQFDDDYADPETGTEYYLYDSDLTDTHRTGQLSITAKGRDIPVAIDLVNSDLIKFANEIRSL
jgi:hypothetical protein